MAARATDVSFVKSAVLKIYFSASDKAVFFESVLHDEVIGMGIDADMGRFFYAKFEHAGE